MKGKYFLRTASGENTNKTHVNMHSDVVDIKVMLKDQSIFLVKLYNAYAQGELNLDIFFWQLNFYLG